MTDQRIGYIDNRTHGEDTLSPCPPALQQEAREWVKDCNDRHAAATGRRRGVFVLTFGCQQNEADSEKISGMAVDMGYTPVERPEDADLILVNTCAIREHAEKRALSMIGQYKALKQRNPELIIGVCGCMAAEAHRRAQLKTSYPYVTFTLGPSSLGQLPRLIRESLEGRGRSLKGECPQDVAAGMVEGVPVRRSSGYKAWVSVMYGCNNFCSYCIVPYVRGQERSREKADVVREVRELVEAGYRDITLLGQNVNSYGRGLETPCDFADLLAELDTIPGDWWLRFMTSHPKDAGHKLIDVMSEARHIVPAFHLPLQSGSDRILRAMNRHYDMQRYLETVSYMKERIPRLTLSSDIIVGFPGETEEDFEETLHALRTVQFDMLYAFIYSPRKGTPAAEMQQLPPDVQKARFARLLALQDSISLTRNQATVGQTVCVLCDGPGKTDPTTYTGRTEGNKSVFFAGIPDMIGAFVQVKIDRAGPYGLFGKTVQPSL